MQTLATKSQRKKSTQRGFTIVEMLITMMVIAIIASIAYPSFVASMRKSNRSDAATALTRAAGNLERFFATNGTYTTVLTDLGLRESGLTEKGHYKIVVKAGPTGIGSSYIIAAVADSTMQKKDTGCDELTLDSLGQQTPDPAESDCW